MKETSIRPGVKLVDVKKFLDALAERFGEPVFAYFNDFRVDSTMTKEEIVEGYRGHMKEVKEADICQTCEHYWTDFRVRPEKEYIPHCEVIDSMPGVHDMTKEVSYPCLSCPLNSYSKKIE